MPILTTLIAGLYALGLWYWLRRVRKTISISATRVLIWTHIALLVLFLILAFLSIQYNVSLRGVWPSRFVTWLFLLTGIPTFIIGHKSQFNTLTRLYFFTFSILPTLIGIFLLIPFLGVVIGLSILLQLSGTGDTVLYDNEDIRIQTTFLGVLVPPFLDIYKKDGLFEKRVYRSESGWYGGVDSVKTITNKHLMTVTIYHDTTEYRTNPLIVTIPD